jgi:putative hemolysin
MNAKIKIASIALVFSTLVLSACAANPPPSGSPTGTPKAEITNPATASCELKGYRSQIRTTSDGSQYGVCIFPDGSECEEWAFYRSECVPEPENPTSGTDSPQIANPASVNCLQKGGRLEIRTTANGSQYGVCIFSDGSACEEWAYLRDECAPASEKPTMGTDSSQIANPASAYCEEEGGKVDIRTAEDGSQGGVCVYPDGSECEEWAFYRGECTPGSNIPSK